MAESTFSGKAGMSSSFTENEDSDEWRIKIFNEMDNPDYPLFQVELTVGRAWARHEYIDFGFDANDVKNDSEKRKKLDEILLDFYSFQKYIEFAYLMFEAAAKKVLDELPEAE